MLGIKKKDELRKHNLYGAIFETMVVSDYMKQKYFNAMIPDLYFYRDTNQLEVDLIDNDEKKAYEIKASMTKDRKYLKNLIKVSEILKIKKENLACIYIGDKTIKSEQGSFVSYRNMFSEL